MARSAAVALLVVAVALGIGMVGYRAFEPMSWVDAFVNAAMILSGMGRCHRCKPTGAKFSPDATRCSAAWRSSRVIGIVFAPAFHRFLHKFHLEEAKRDQGKDKDTKVSS